MPEAIHLMVWTLSERMLDVANVQWVHVRLAQERTITVWPGHAPLLAETAADALEYADAAGKHTIDLPAGIVQVEDNLVTLFLVGALGDQEWPQEEEAQRFDRLAQAMLGALEAEGVALERLAGPGRD